MSGSDWFSKWSYQIYTYIKGLNLEQIEALLDRYSDLGPLPGILLPLLEAFLPFLPLIVFLFANASAYGMWPGFLYSWIGVCTGAILVFLIARAAGRKYGAWIRRHFPKTERFFTWMESKGFTPIFLLSCFPFTPSVFVNISAGLSNMPLHSFVTAILLGKSVMIFLLSYLGADLEAMFRQPWRFAVAALVLAAMWYGGKLLEARYQLKK
jgi:uncharacterized membrane protein YdjX (TVP38/TMEM64 family)